MRHPFFRLRLLLIALGTGVTLSPAAEVRREPAAAPPPAAAPVDRDLQEMPVSPEQWEQYRKLRVGAFTEYALQGGVRVRDEVEAVSPEAVIVRSFSAGTRLRFRVVPRPSAGEGVVRETLIVAGKPVAAERTETKVQGVVRARLWTSREIPVLGGGVVKNEVGGTVIVELSDFAFRGPPPTAAAAVIDSGKTVDTTVPREQWEQYRKLQVGAFAEYQAYGTVTRHEVLQADPEAVVFQTISAGTITRSRAMPPPEEVTTRRTETVTVAGKPVVAERAETTAKGVVVSRVWTSREVPVLGGGVVRQESFGEATRELKDFGFGK
ncbi:MAG: hypothetical protein ACKOUK_11875 [Verrucomicrobiota bacterium]